MKIGILTYHFTTNIGSVLQAYALQNTILQMGHECDIINYQKENWKEKENEWYKKSLKNRFRSTFPLIWILFLIMNGIRMHKFYCFRKKHLRISPKRVLHKDELLSLTDKYDCFIVGSDQIWNYNNTKFDYTYLLDFVSDNVKKNAYAPSFGVTSLDDGNRSEYKELLTQFNYLSAREIQGSSLVKDLVDGDCPVLIDPSLLLDMDEWSKLVTSRKISGEYVLLYLMVDSQNAVNFAEGLAKMNNCKVVQIVNYHKRKHNNEFVRNVSPVEWLSLISNAKYVVTNSFHGIAFSINFNKEFFVEPLKTSSSDTNSRLDSIINMFSLQERILNEETNMDKIKSIDYGSINKTLEQKRNEAKKYLELILSHE